MFRRLFAMTRIGFKLEFAYPISFLFFLVLPLAFTAAVGAGLGGMMGGGDEAPQSYKTVIYVISQDDGPLVDALLAALAENDLVPERVHVLPEDSFGLEIPADFSARLRKGEDVTVTLHTRPTTTASQAVEQYVQASVSRLGGAALVAEMGLDQAREATIVASETEERDFFNEILMETLAASEEPVADTQLNWAGETEITSLRDSPTSAEQASAGQIITWTQITFLAAAEVFVAEREAGTLRRLLITPTRRSLTLGGKLLSRLILGLVQMAILFLGGSILFGVNWGQSPLALAAVSLAFALATVCLGLMIATFVRSRGQANSIVVGLAMGLSALGGAWYPLEITPPIYREVVKILPSTWAMQAYTDLLVQNAAIQDVLPAIGVLLLFALVFIVAGIWRFQKMAI